ncbi:YfiR family protein [Chitinimonas arctica]|uniref:YfiR family protein n=1 Tax=Chitinimonas arctica TaxID=2594795 RepID=A0A516SA20_9NEIS|nr:YfiR family protein [Chitinimonas arctica]QDQ25003.1 YfiR family protein [Chitinimonas arctica]
MPAESNRPIHAIENWRPLLLAVLAWLFASLTASWADSEIEYQVKAAYLYKFTSYVEWPESVFSQADSALTIGVLDADVLAEELGKLLVGRTVNNRHIVLKRLKPGAPLTGVQILFIGRHEADRLKALLESLQAQPILVVTESAGALNLGSVINFVQVDNRIRFEISRGMAEKNSLKLSARLLAVAQQIRNEAP